MVFAFYSPYYILSLGLGPLLTEGRLSHVVNPDLPQVHYSKIAKSPTSALRF